MRAIWTGSISLYALPGESIKRIENQRTDYRRFSWRHLNEAYNEYYKITTGNPYKELIFELIKQDSQIEEPEVSIHNHQGRNEEMLCGVKEDMQAWFW